MSFGLPGQKVSWGALSKGSIDLIRKSAASWADSPFLDSRHSRENLMCSACHGQSLPAAGEEVENDICLGCHGSEEKLAAKTVQPESPKFNPHKSHLFGLACTKCHAGHQESKVYCLECHKDLTMKIPGGADGK
jgi:fumarate reductase flavoprotein subunit